MKNKILHKTTSLNTMEKNMPFQILEQALVKEIEHINELFHKKELGEISIEDQAKDELREIRKTLREQIEKSKRYSSNIYTEGDCTLKEMVETMEIMREVVCKIEISAIKRIMDGTMVRYIEIPKIKRRGYPKVNRIIKTYIEE